MSRGGMAGHESPTSQTVTWLTPPELLRSLGQFDLDPCTPLTMPWKTAAQRYTELDDGLSSPWFGRVWVNPPYGPPPIIAPWIEKLADHGNGVALIFARTETGWFQDLVWKRAQGLLFLRGRLSFCFPDGTRAKANSGAPSVLVAYGRNNADCLRRCGLEGAFVNLQREDVFA